MKKKMQGYSLQELLEVVFYIVIALLYVENILKLIWSFNSHITLLQIFRIVGILIPPLGAIMGLF